MLFCIFVNYISMSFFLNWGSSDTSPIMETDMCTAFTHITELVIETVTIPTFIEQVV